MSDVSRGVSRLMGLVLFGLGLAIFPQVSKAAVQPLSLPEARVGTPYMATVLGAPGQTEPYYWEVSTTTMSIVLPQGMTAAVSENRNLVFRGTPTEAGTFQFTALPFSASGTQVMDGFLLNVMVRPESETPRIMSSTSARMGMVGVPFSSESVARVTGGVAPYRWTMIQGGLPAGLRFTSQGMIEGTPTVSGQYIFQAEVSDANDRRAVASIMVWVEEGPMGSGSWTGGSTSPVIPAPFVVPSSLSLLDRQAILSRAGVTVNTVVQTTELDPLMQRPTLYYIGTDARRHPFQDEQTYQSWYASALANTQSIPRAQLAEIPFGDVVTYRPGERVKFQTEAQTYAVTAPKVLRPLASTQVEGLVWQQGVRELDQVSRGAYRMMMEPVMSSNYDPAISRAQYMTPSAVLGE